VNGYVIFLDHGKLQQELLGKKVL